MAPQVTIITDSCASLPAGAYEHYGIVMVPYYINLASGDTVRDLVDMTHAQFLDMLRVAKELPKTANPGPGDYIEAFKKAAQQSQSIISIHMTSKGSGAYQAATVAKEMAATQLPGVRIEVVDTLNVSMCHGWLTLEAARAAERGASADEILALIGRMMPVTVMLQTVDTLRYLYMGGRIGRAKHLMGTLLNVKPILTMTNGIIEPLGQARGTKAVYEKMMNLIAERVGNGGAIHAAVVQTGDFEASATLRSMLQQRFQCDELVTADLSSALAVHTGPGTSGICYYPSAVLQA